MVDEWESLGSLVSYENLFIVVKEGGINTSVSGQELQKNEYGNKKNEANWEVIISTIKRANKCLLRILCNNGWVRCVEMQYW